MKYVIINAKLLNGHRDMHVEEGKYIYVNEGKIEKITKSLEDGYDIVDLEGKYILPGLINMHVHLAGNGAHSGKQKDNKKTVDFLFSNPVRKQLRIKWYVILPNWNCMVALQRFVLLGV